MYLAINILVPSNLRKAKYTASFQFVELI